MNKLSVLFKRNFNLNVFYGRNKLDKYTMTYYNN